MDKYAAIIDANINRISEGLRVIEEYYRFVTHEAEFAKKCADFRKSIHKIQPQSIDLLSVRDINKDTRAKEVPAKRSNSLEILTANFKRVAEALRVLEEYTGDPRWNELRYDVYELEKHGLIQFYKPVLKQGVYVISDTVEVLKDASEKGAVMVQLRAKSDSKQQIFEKALAVKAFNLKVPFIINDHLDIAVSVQADGVHTGQDDLSPKAQRELLGPAAIIGKTTHSLEQGTRAVKDGADYISVGPIWPTPSKPDRDPIGLEYVKQVGSLNIPFVVIGGIHADRLKTLHPFSPPMIGVIRDYKNVLNECQKLNYFEE